MTKVSIRIAAEDDLPSLAMLYTDAVRTTGPSAYSTQQVESWAATVDDADRFRDFILRPTTYVAVEDDQPVGFAGIEDDGHVTSVYLRGDRQRRGIGAQLMHVILDHARQANIDRLYAEASEFSLPLFLKIGFESIGTEKVERNGSIFLRHLVERAPPLPQGREGAFSVVLV